MTTTVILVFHLLWTSLICGTLLALFTCCRKKAKAADGNGKSQMSTVSPSARTAVYDSKSLKQKNDKKKNKPTKKEVGVTSTYADGFPLFPLLKTEDSTLVCTLSASGNTNDESMKKSTHAKTMQSMTKSVVKSAPINVQTAMTQKEAVPLPPATTKPVSKEEKSKETSKDPKTMVSKEEVKDKNKVGSSKAETPKVETSKTETSKETSKATSTASSKEDETSKMDKAKEHSTEASSVTKSGTEISIEEEQADSTDTSNKDSKDASDKKK